MRLKEEGAKVDALRNSDPRELGRRAEPANETERRSQTDGRKARRLWGRGSQEEMGLRAAGNRQHGRLLRGN